MGERRKARRDGRMEGHEKGGGLKRKGKERKQKKQDEKMRGERKDKRKRGRTSKENRMKGGGNVLTNQEGPEIL